MLRKVLSTIDFSNYTPQQSEIIVNVVKETTNNIIISHENLSNLSYRKGVTLIVIQKSISKLKNEKHLDVHNWIPKPQKTNINKIVKNRNSKISYWIPKPPKR